MPVLTEELFVVSQTRLSLSSIRTIK